MLKPLCMAFALTLAGSGIVVGAPLPSQPGAKLPIIPVANGCGPGYFRTLAGECIPNQRVGGRGRRGFAPPPCPRGYLRDPDPARPLCYPVY